MNNFVDSIVEVDMSYFADWNKEIEQVTANGQSNQFVKDYYRLEQQAYDRILKSYPDVQLSGKFTDIQDKLGFAGESAIFLGFLEGINPCLTSELDLDSLGDDSVLDLQIDFAKLLYNMYDAKANWLYDLDSWQNVFSDAEHKEIAKKFRTDHIAVSNKIGRNDPCPCGSGKKYKACCGKN
ncbi:hypothetical protein HMPREF0868_0892 [Mageeibacillus indolicus UPII9-5]|uniref:SEC-C domain-containing protein n=2 Tax=Mageeibacillus indolicus TaxID=884684 RepID=D3R1Z8_MAGIU|nr:hypothetical protein HMPREF0868_0892 [Mageeibacillus indolicus UPII9-5]